MSQTVEQPEVETDEHSRMSLGEHLDELRRRLVYGLIGLCLAAVVTFYFGEWLVWWLLQPLMQVQQSLGLPPQTVSHAVTTGFSIYMRVSIIFAAIISAPWLLYQLWKFVSTGLYHRERRVVMFIAPLSAAMSALGVLFMYYVLLPISLAFLMYFATTYPPPSASGKGMLNMMVQMSMAQSRHDDASTPEVDVDPQTPPPAVVLPMVQTDPSDPVAGQMWIKMPENQLRIYLDGKVRNVALTANSLVSPLIEVAQYIDFVLMMAVGVVLAFQTPLIMLIGSWSGALTVSMVARYRKHSILACFVLGAALTPADPLSMFVLAIPLWALFEVGLLLMRMHERKLVRDEGPMV